MYEVELGEDTAYAFENAEELADALWDGWWKHDAMTCLLQKIEQLKASKETHMTLNTGYGVMFGRRASYIAAATYTDYENGYNTVVKDLFPPDGVFSCLISPNTSMQVMTDALVEFANNLQDVLSQYGYDEIEIKMSDELTAAATASLYLSWTIDSPVYMATDGHELMLSIDNPDPYHFMISMIDAEDENSVWTGTPLTIDSGVMDIPFTSYAAIYDFPFGSLIDFFEANGIARNTHLEAHTRDGMIPEIVFTDEWLTEMGLK